LFAFAFDLRSRRYHRVNRLTGLNDNTKTIRVARFTGNALGRRIAFADDLSGNTQQYYSDEVNEVASINEEGTTLAHWVHGVSYADERLMMWTENKIGTQSTFGEPPNEYYLNLYQEIRRAYNSAVDRKCNGRGIVELHRNLLAGGAATSPACGIKCEATQQ